MKVKRKGFTLVELLVVIAILAVLATVAILGYSAFTKKATISNDEAVVAQMNVALAGAEVEGKALATVYEAVEVIKDAGFILGNLTPTTVGYDIIYDMESKRFYLYGDKQVVYKDNKTSKTVVEEANKDKQFTVIHAATTKNTTTEDNPLSFGAYLYVDYDNGEELDASWKKTIYISKGFDTGNVNCIEEIYYKNKTGNAQSVVIRTNGGDLVVEAPLDVVYHYNFADTVEIKQICGASYHENGEVSFMEVASGNIVLESSSDVSFLHFDANEDNMFENKDTSVGITLDVTNAVNIPEFSRDQVEINKETGTKVCEVKTKASEEAVWLWQYGIEEQMKLTSTEATQATSQDDGVGGRTDDTAELAREIANMCGRSASGKPLSSSGQELELNNDGTFKDNTINSLSDLQKPTTGYVKEKETVINEAIVFGGGNGSELSPFRIRCREDFEFIYSHYDTYYYYDVDVDSGLWAVNPGEVSEKNTVVGATGNSADGKAHMDASNWTLKLTDSGNYTTRNNIYGSLKGNGLVIDNLDAWLFKNVGNSLTDNTPIVISDLEFNMNFTLDGASGAAAVFRNVGCKEITLKNITVHGDIYGNTCTGSFFGFGACNFDGVGCNYKVNFENCNSDASLYDIGNGAVGGFIGHTYPGTGHIPTLNFVNSSYTGTTYTANSNSSCNISAMFGTCNVSGSNNAQLPDSRKKVITKATIAKENDGFKVTVPTGATYVVINIFAQLTQYYDNGSEVPNQGGITMSLSAEERSSLTAGSSIKVVNPFSSIVETKRTGNFSTAKVEDNILKLDLLGNQSGYVYIKVSFFDRKAGTIISTGTLQIASKDNSKFNDLTAWVIK